MASPNPNAAILTTDSLPEPTPLIRPNPPKRQLKLSEVRKLAQEREKREVRTMVLPELSAEGGEDAEFVVTYKRMSMQQVVQTGHVTDEVRDLADAMLEGLNAAALALPSQDRTYQPRTLAGAGVLAAIELYGATEYERLSDELQKAMIMSAVISPQIVESEDELDYTDPDTQLPYTWIPDLDARLLYNAINGMEKESVARDLKSVSAEPEGAEEGAETTPEDGAEVVQPPEDGDRSEHEAESGGGDRTPSLADGLGQLVPRGDKPGGRANQTVRKRAAKPSAEG